MIKSVGVREAKMHFSRLLADVAAGDEVVITRRGEAVAALVPVRQYAARKLGLDRGVLVVPKDFDAPFLDPYGRFDLG